MERKQWKSALGAAAGRHASRRGAFAAALMAQMWLVSLSFGLLFIALVSTMTQFIPRVQASGFTMEEGTLWLSIASVLGILGS